MDKPFYSNGLLFTCLQCSACCRHDPGFVYLSEKDLEKLQKWSTLDRDTFISTFCRWVPCADGLDYLTLKEKPDYDCILWENGCTAYENRPLQCSAFPFWASLLQDEDWWNAAAADCPGMNKGAFHDAGVIQEHLHRRRAEPCITRPQYNESRG